jgi:2-polyprenyl-3-methyl-5-hydroxy-6-metoxy-1,4-benzoquinol methylase
LSGLIIRDILIKQKELFMNCLLCKKTVENTINRELRGGEKVPVFYCSKCDLGMLAVKKSQKEVAKYYLKKYRKIGSPKLGQPVSPNVLFEMAKPFQQDRIDLLKKYFGKNKRVLEVGCSAGMFLWHAKKDVGEIVGIDYDKKSADFAAKKCRCRVYSTDIEKTNLKEKSFDIICAFQTLEHTVDPIDFVDKYKKYLKPKGIMAIEVPNLNDALVHVYNLPNHKHFFYHISHLWYFTEKSLNKLMTLSGFQGKTFFTQDYNLFNHINWIINDQPQPTSIFGLSKPKIPFRNNVGKKIEYELNHFMEKADIEYKKELSNLKITSNIFYLGRKI